MEQIIQKIIEWITARGGKCTIEELRAFLESIGLSNSFLGEIDAIIGALDNNGFLIQNGDVTYRGMNYRDPLPPNRG